MRRAGNNEIILDRQKRERQQLSIYIHAIVICCHDHTLKYKHTYKDTFIHTHTYTHTHTHTHTSTDIIDLAVA